VALETRVYNWDFMARAQKTTCFLGIGEFTSGGLGKGN